MHLTIELNISPRFKDEKKKVCQGLSGQYSICHCSVCQRKMTGSLSYTQPRAGVSAWIYALLNDLHRTSYIKIYKALIVYTRRCFSIVL